MATKHKSSPSTVSISKSQKYTPMDSRLIEQIMLFTRLLDNEGDSEKLLRLPGIEIAASDHGAKFIGSNNTETHE